MNNQNTDTNESIKRQQQNAHLGFVSIARAKDLTTIFRDLATFGAIIAGAIWFFAQGEFRSRVNVTHEINFQRVTDKWTWVHVTVTVANQGKRSIHLSNVLVKIDQVLPLDEPILKKLSNDVSPIHRGETKVKWPTLAHYYTELDVEIRPGEQDRDTYEFFIPSAVTTAKIYTFYSEKPSSKFGWREISIYNIPLEGGKP